MILCKRLLRGLTMKDKLYYLGLNTNALFWKTAPDHEEAHDTLDSVCDYLDNALLESGLYDVALNTRLNPCYRNFDIYSYESTKENIHHALKIIKEYKHLRYFDHCIVEY